MIKIVTVFGTELVKAIDDGESPDDILEIANNEASEIRRREFDTPEERQAYILGLVDSNGWREYSILEEAEEELLKEYTQ